MGGLGSCLGKTIFDVWFSNCDYFKLPAVAGPSNIRSGKIPEIKIPLILQSTQDDSNLNLGSSNVPSGQGPVNDINWTSIWQIPLKTFNEEISPCFEQYTRILQDMNSKSLSYTLEVPRDNEDPSITEASLINSLLSVLQTHSKMIQGSFAGREGLVSELRHLLSEEDQRIIEELSTRKDKVLDDYLENISRLQGSMVKGLLKRFSDATNGYGREMTKLAREQDDIIRRGLKGHPVNRKPEFKKMIRTDYPEVLRSFQKEDDALRKRFSLLFNQPKKKTNLFLVFTPIFIIFFYLNLSMYYSITIISLIEVVLVLVPALVGIAYVTVAERKTMASMQRRLGPNAVGYYGLLQAFADALKLLLKEYVAPTQANIILFFLGPVITLIFSLLGYAVIPYGPGLTVNDFSLGIYYLLAVSSLATYGILLAGWSANSKYAFLGSLRSTAQLISYELVLSSAILLVIMLTGSLNLTVNTESQRAIWYVLPLLPVFIIFFIGSVAETNRAPFDLAEAESELVSGFMTEHAAVVFVFFFLAEYGSIVLICILTSILFLGGYLLINILEIFNINIFDCIYFIGDYSREDNFWKYYYIYTEYFLNNSIVDGLFYGLSLGLKSSILIFIFIWVRASFPRIRFDQLMAFCWTVLLPILFGLIVLIPCILYSYNIFPVNISLL